MSEARAQPEPSMEEILASIRRIISEDGVPAQAPGQGPSDEGETAAPSRPAEPAASPAAQATPAPAQAAPVQPAQAPASSGRAAPVAPAPVQPAPPQPASMAEGEDDALLLTEMVTEDGTVVSLAGKAAPEAPIQPLPEPPLPEPPLPEPPLPEPPTPPAAAAGSSLAAPPVQPAPPAEVEEPELAPLEIEPEMEPEPEPVAMREPEPEISVEEPEPESEPVAGRDVGRAMEQEAPTMPKEAMQAATPEQAGDRLVSEATFAASTSALSQLSRTVRRDKDFPLGGGRMVEDLVREALEPMLKEWLDANLQGIVERLVRQEIERMVRRAEEDS